MVHVLMPARFHHLPHVYGIRVYFIRSNIYTLSTQRTHRRQNGRTAHNNRGVRCSFIEVARCWVACWKNYRVIIGGGDNDGSG